MEGCLIIVAVGIVVVVILYISSSMQQVDAELKRNEQRHVEENAARAQELAEQQKILDRLLVLNDESLRSLEVLPLKIEAAEKHLDQAKSDFAENAFAPFWDSVQKAAIDLAEFDHAVHSIEVNTSTYSNLLTKYNGASPPFAVSRHAAPRLAVARETTKRMHEIVRQAQRNFQFAMIYEQRKTNQILVAGFKNLAQALDEMSQRITTSLDDLRDSVSRIDESVSGIREHIGQLAADSAAYRNEAAGRSAREEKALEMLDNIQRRRYPSFEHGGLR